MFLSLVSKVYAQDFIERNFDTPDFPKDKGFSLFDFLRLGSGNSQTVADVYQTPAVLVNHLVNIALIIGGIILFGMIVYAGFLFLQDSEKGAEKAQQVLTAAFVGFIIMFAAYWIVQIVKLVTGANIVL